jgi:arylformamidase
MNPHLSPDWFDRMYNNRALVPDFANHLQQWTRDSQAVRDSQPCLTDISYGSGPSETLDIFTATKPVQSTPNQSPQNHRPSAANSSSSPVLVFLHGGYWRALDKSDHSFVAPSLTQQGLTVVVPNYALCPAVTIPEIVMQMVKALAWVWRHIDTWGGDVSRIHVAGHSAGGHLAAMMLACDWRAYAPDLPPDLVKSALSVSGLYELDSLRRSPMLQEALRLDEQQVLMASPAWLPAPKRGVLHSVVGGLESEAFLAHNQLIQNAWGRERVPTAQVLPGLHHFSMMKAFATPGHALNQQVLALCQAQS